jgi:hypothetical protein
MPEGVQGQVVEQLGENEFARIHGAIRINGELQHLRSVKPSSSRWMEKSKYLITSMAYLMVSQEVGDRRSAKNSRLQIVSG